ncbi:AAA family ATPase [Myceligenerans pegani]|nr:AAA family ATPase [Myceligenerans sp. TRM 65318]
MGWRFSSAAEREQVITRVVDAAEAHSVRLTPDELAPTPATLQRADGSSRLRPQHHAIYSSEQVLADEERLLILAGERTGPLLPDRAVTAVVHRNDEGRRPSVEQANAVQQVATSGRVVDVLVGPAGAGKTTTLRALVRAWTARHGPGSVVGLAPSATAAKVLADDVGQPAETTAKWLTEHRHGRTRLARGQLVIVDEATLTGTHTLARLAALAADVGAKLLLTGDPAQLQAVDTGGAFAMLVGRLMPGFQPGPYMPYLNSPNPDSTPIEALTNPTTANP